MDDIMYQLYPPVGTNDGEFHKELPCKVVWRKNELPEAPHLEDEISDTVFGSCKSIFVTIPPSLRTISVRANNHNISFFLCSYI